MVGAVYEPSKYDKFIAAIFATRAVTFVWLAFASSEYMPLYADIVLVLRYITILLGPIYILNRGRVGVNNNIIMPVIFYWLMLVINTYGGYKGSYLHELVTISCFLLMKDEIKVMIFKYFYKIIIFSCIIAVCFYAAVILRIPIGYTTVPFFNDGEETSIYIKWLIFAIVGDGQYGFPRMCAIFNEPGALGTVCALLYAATYTYSRKWEKCVLVASIALSFSVGGFLLLLIFYAMLNISKGIKYSIPLFALFVSFLIAPSIDWGNEFLNDFVARFKITDEGLAGDDRVNQTFERLYTQFHNSSNVLFGMGATYADDSGASSYKRLIIQFGYIGTGIYFLLFINQAIKIAANNKYCILLLAVFVISIYQRPVALTNAYGYTLIFGGMLAILNSQMQMDR